MKKRGGTATFEPTVFVSAVRLHGVVREEKTNQLDKRQRFQQRLQWSMFAMGFTQFAIFRTQFFPFTLTFESR